MCVLLLQAAVEEDIFGDVNTTEAFGFLEGDDSSCSENSDDDGESEDEAVASATTNPQDDTAQIPAPPTSLPMNMPHARRVASLLSSTSSSYGVPPFGSPTYTPKLRFLQTSVGESGVSNRPFVRLEPISQILRTPLRMPASLTSSQESSQSVLTSGLNTSEEATSSDDDEVTQTRAIGGLTNGSRREVATSDEASDTETQQVAALVVT